MVVAVRPSLVWLCVIDPVVKAFLIMISVGCLRVLRTMRWGTMRGIRHGSGRKSPRRRKRGHGKSQTSDKNGPGPAHDVVNYVTQHLEVK